MPAPGTLTQSAQDGAGPAGRSEGGRPTHWLVPLLYEAAERIRTDADDLKAAHAPDGDWTGEELAKVDHDRDIRLSARLTNGEESGDKAMTDEMEDAFEVEDALKANRERREQIEELKKRHDVIYMQGVAALEKMKSAYTLVTKLRKEIKALEGDDYDPIWLLFNGTFNDDEEDDDGEP